jgi:hypothetical protein
MTAPMQCANTSYRPAGLAHDVGDGHRHVRQRGVFEAPGQGGGRHAGAGAQVQHPHIALVQPEVARKRMRNLRVREGVAARAVAVQQHDRRLCAGVGDSA